MHSHPNARLTQKGWLRLINQHRRHQRPLAELAADVGISLRCAYKWLARYRSGGTAAFMDQGSVRRSQRRTLAPQHLQFAVEVRHQRLHLRHIAHLLHAHFSTMARVLNRLGLGRLRIIEPEPPVQRYERQTPGDVIHIDVKSWRTCAGLGTASRLIGSRAVPQSSSRTGSRGDRRRHRTGYVEVLADE